METILTVSLVAILGTVVAALHVHLTAQPPEPVTGWSTEDIDAEFFSIIERERLRESP